MKILEAVRAFYPSQGGQETAVYNLIKGLQRRGLAIELITTDFNASGAPEFEVFNGIPVHRMKQFTAYNVTPSLPKFLSSMKYDLVHVHGFGRFYTDFIALYCKSAGKKCVFTPHGFFHTPARALAKKIYVALIAKPVLSLFDAMIVFTEEEKKFWHEKFHVPKSKIYVIPHFLPEGFTKHEKTSILSKLKLKEPFVLFLGRLDRNKRVDLLLRAFSKLENNEVKLVIVGKDAGQKKHLMELISQLGLSTSVIFTDFVSEDEKKELLEKCEFLCLPTEYEAFGLVIIESYAFGKPVAATGLPILRELIKNRKTGILFQNNENNIKNSLEEMHYLVKSRGDFLKRNCLKEAAKYSEKAAIQKYIAVFNRFLGTS